MLEGNFFISGYEIHAGKSTGPALQHPAIRFPEGADGALSDNGQVLGTYLHGLFDNREACQALLQWAGLPNPEDCDYQARREQDINRLADSLEQNLDLEMLFERIIRSG